jgi:purine catabolism regulator
VKLTVNDALKLQPLCLSAVIAGRRGVDREIQSVTLIEIPDRTEFLQPHLLAISSLYAVANDVEGQLSLIRLLNAYKGCGLILFNVGLVVPTIHPRLIELCDELDFPLMTMPLEISYYQVIEAVMDQLLERQSQKLETSISLYEAFMDQLLDSRDDYSSMLGMLEKNINHGILLFNHNQKCVYAASGMPEESLIHQLVKEIQIGLGRSGDGLPMGERVATINCTPYLLTPVVNKHTYYGTLIVADMDTPTDLDRLALSQTQKALCVAAFGNVRMDEYYERMRGEYLRDLLQGNYGNEELIISQGRELEYDVQNICCVIAAAPFACDSEERARTLNSLYLHARRIMPEDIVAFVEETVVILCNHNGRSDFMQPARSISAAVEASCGHAPSIGVGSMCTNVNEIPLSYKRAADVILLSSRIYNAPRCESYASMRLYDLLFNSINESEAARIVNSLLEPLRRYDKTYNANLEQTFCALLNNNDSTAQVAETMFLHKNTVLQRRNKIVSLYKGDPFASPERLQFELALLLQRIFDIHT